MKRILNFIFWPSSKKILLLQAFLLVMSIRLALWLLPFGLLNKWLINRSVADRLVIPDWNSVREAAAFVRFSSRFVLKATCLTQALATRTLLGRMGFDSHLKIGVDKKTNQGILAHAWIEVDGKIVIGKVRDIGKYSVMSGLGLEGHTA